MEIFFFIFIMYNYTLEYFTPRQKHPRVRYLYEEVTYSFGKNLNRRKPFRVCFSIRITDICTLKTDPLSHSLQVSVIFRTVAYVCYVPPPG